MGILGGIFAVLYVVCLIAIMIYIIRLMGRFVSAHERVATALESIAAKFRNDIKP
jgi:Na+-transporting methylmalonyl-CoA/oxaloacetate decarboxylase gamma subunit